jgi:trehalose/maltose hydrolase-like predicted phosphorylase
MLNISSDYNCKQTQQLIDTFGWQIIETEFNPSVLHHKETVFSLGNGYLGTRGTFEEGYPQECTATLIHGLYDDVPIGYTELVNCPNWLPLKIKIAGESFSLHNGEILKYERRLDLRLGLISRDIRWQSPKGDTLEFHFERFVSLSDEHTLAIRCEITSIDFEGEIEIEAGFVAEPDTQGIEHWNTLNEGSINNTSWLHSQTLQSHIQLGIASKLVITEEAKNKNQHKEGKEEGEKGTKGEEGNFSQSSTPPPNSQLPTPHSLTKGQKIVVEKIVTVFTSRETQTPLELALKHLDSAPSYITLLAAHIAAWDRVWQDCDVHIEGDENAQLSIRYNIFQLLAAAPRHDDRVSIAPKTLSGYPYRGHIFWDTEIFVLPLLTYTQPELARNLLTYRYHTLGGARRKAQELGLNGAMYAWESASTGDEVTPRWVPSSDGGVIRIWCGDIEVHITTDVAYAVWNYWKSTGDDTWMRDYGAEIILDTAVFWESRVEWNPERQSYDIRDVIGPDENHDHVDNNAFTNIMVQWHLETALEVWNWLLKNHPSKYSKLREQLNILPVRLQRWVEIASGLHINQDPETGLIEQFEGFFQLEDVNLANFADRTTSMQAILGVESTNQTQILKQADVLMLLYLLRSRFDQKTKTSNWDYYTPRTDHAYGSSLSPAIHALVACELGKTEEAYTHFMRAALVDLEDTRRNAAEGIHAASAGGVWQAIVFGFGGVSITENGPVAHPNLPPNWTRLKFKLQWRNQWYEFDSNTQIEEDSHVEISHDEHQEILQQAVM